METRPEVSVVIPTRDRWTTLVARALPSALGQRDVTIEILVVEDGSRGRPHGGAQLLAARGVRVIAHDASRGLAAARNVGIWSAAAPWVAFLDDDDLWSPDKLRSQLDLAQSTNAGLVYSPALYVNEAGEIVECAPAPAPENLVTALLAGEAIPAGGSNVLVRTDVVRRAGGFDERYVHLGDFECWVRVGRVCNAARVSEPLVAYVQHPRAMHLSEARRVLSDARRLHASYSVEYARSSVRFDADAFLAWVAHQHRLLGNPRRAAGVYLLTGLRHRKPQHLLRAAVFAFAGQRFDSLRRRLRRSLHRQALSSGRESGPQPRSHTGSPEAPAWLKAYLPLEPVR